MAAFRISATPDTGCTKTIINERIVRRHKLNILNNEQTLLVAANGERMPVTGTTSLTAGANGASYRIHALVSPAITEDMLVSCNDLIRLEIIPQNFPNDRIQNCRSIKQFKDVLIGEFPTVLSNDLNPEPMKTEKPMPITLLPTRIPFLDGFLSFSLLTYL